MATIDLDAVRAATDALFDPATPHPQDARSLAVVVMQSGEVVHERYGEQPDTLFGPGGPVTSDDTLISWSMAKSITHAAVGILVDEDRLQLDAPAPVPAWRGTDKEAITLQHLLNMRPGLLFVEDYVDGSVSHVIEMLFGEGKDDVAAYAAGQPLIHEPGSVWNYSSGTTNIIARIVGDVVGGGRAGMESFLQDRLFGPAGMHSAIPKFDTAGTFIGSSYVYATARDFARFGELYRNDGVASDGTRVLPAGWRDHARTPTATDDDGFGYGAQWWLWPDFSGSLGCHGYEGQYTVVLPDRELVVVHLGKYPADVRGAVEAQLRTIFHAARP
ncbi:MAG: beta-lactamase family protein [Actinobacteria bacterium]|nr:beta-lactamase family protein [Actinomycetota bacterium]